MAGIRFQNKVDNPKYFPGAGGKPYPTNYRLGTSTENGKLTSSGREFFTFMSFLTPLPQSPGKNTDQLLTNNAYACNENYDTYNGYVPDPSTASTQCTLAPGGTTSTASVKILNDFEDVLIRIIRSDTNGDTILNRYSSPNYDPAVCGNSSEVHTAKPAMLVNISNITGRPNTIPEVQEQNCYLPTPRYYLCESLTRERTGI